MTLNPTTLSVWGPLGESGQSLAWRGGRPERVVTIPTRAKVALIVVPLVVLLVDGVRQLFARMLEIPSCAIASIRTLATFAQVVVGALSLRCALASVDQPFDSRIQNIALFWTITQDQLLRPYIPLQQPQNGAEF